MKAAISNYAKVYASYLETIVIGGSKEIALQFAVMDMMNQVKNTSEENAIFIINDEAEYLKERIAK